MGEPPSEAGSFQIRSAWFWLQSTGSGAPGGLGTAGQDKILMKEENGKKEDQLHTFKFLDSWKRLAENITLIP